MVTSLQLLQLEGDPSSEEDRHLRNAATAQVVVLDREHRRGRTFALALEQSVVPEKTDNAKDVRPLQPSLPLLGNTSSLPGVVPDSSNTRVIRRSATNGRGRRPVAMVTHAIVCITLRQLLHGPIMRNQNLSLRLTLQMRFMITTILGKEIMM